MKDFSIGMIAVGAIMLITSGQTGLITLYAGGIGFIIGGIVHDIIIDIVEG